MSFKNITSTKLFTKTRDTRKEKIFSFFHLLNLNLYLHILIKIKMTRDGKVIFIKNALYKSPSLYFPQVFHCEVTVIDVKYKVAIKWGAIWVRQLKVDNMTVSASFI